MSIAGRSELPQRWAVNPHAWRQTLWVALALLQLSAALCTARAGAEPSVRVRAESRIEIGVEYAEGRLQIRGALRDELAIPIPATAVTVVLRQPTGELIDEQRVMTGPSGRFVVERNAPQDRVVLQAAYAGDGLYRGVRVERRIDHARADVRLELQLPGGPRIDLDRETLEIRVLAESDSGGQALPMTLMDETGRELARGQTDPLGRLTWQVPSTALGAPGWGQLRLESPGDATRGEAQTEARVVRFRRADLELQLPRGPTEAGSAAQVHGRLYTSAGPRAGQPVGLFLNGEHVTTAVTGEDGTFAASLWPEAAGDLVVVARAERDPVGAYTEAQARATLRVVAQRALPWPWIGLAVLPGIALALVRSRRARQRSNAGGRAQPRPEAGVQVGSRQHRRPTETTIGGCIVHARTRQPLPGARVRATQDGATRWELTADGDGRFRGAPCSPGTVTLTVEAPGFAPLSTRVTMPHRGEWSHCEFRLDSLRDQAVRAYRALVLPRLPSALLFNLWTPREIGQRVRRDLGEEIDVLAARVERAAFSADPPDPAEVAEIDARARQLSTAPRGAEGREAGRRSRGASGRPPPT